MVPTEAFDSHFILFHILQPSHLWRGSIPTTFAIHNPWNTFLYGRSQPVFSPDRYARNTTAYMLWIAWIPWILWAQIMFYCSECNKWGQQINFTWVRVTYRWGVNIITAVCLIRMCHHPGFYCPYIYIYIYICVCVYIYGHTAVWQLWHGACTLNEGFRNIVPTVTEPDNLRKRTAAADQVLLTISFYRHHSGNQPPTPPHLQDAKHALGLEIREIYTHYGYSTATALFTQTATLVSGHLFCRRFFFVTKKPHSARPTTSIWKGAQSSPLQPQ